MTRPRPLQPPARQWPSARGVMSSSDRWSCGSRRRRDDRGIVRRRSEDRPCVPHVLTCRLVGLSESWFYKWRDRPPTARQARRARLDAAVRASFDDSGGIPGTYGSPRVRKDLVEDGWRVSKKSVAASMARQGLQGRCPKRKRRSLTRPDKAAAPIPDLLGRDFGAERSTRMVRGPDRDPHRRGQAVPGHRRRPGQPPAARVRPRGPSRRPVGSSRVVRGRRHPWRQRRGVIFHSDKGGDPNSKSACSPTVGASAGGIDDDVSTADGKR